MARLVGREAELRAVHAFVDTLADGADPGPAILVIRGDPGIGKTSIWLEAVDRADERGLAVLEARAAAPEASLTLTTLADLLESRPAVRDIPLPPPQRRALDAVLLDGELDSGPLQPRLLGAAIRSVLAATAARTPVLVAIDDAQWTDPASAVAIGYAIRRLPRRSVGLVLAQRSGERLPFDPRSLVGPERSWTIDLGPLTVAALHQLLKERAGQAPSRSTLIRIHEASRGSPLFALEIARLLEATGVPPAGQPLPVPPDVRALLRDRVAALPAQARETLLFAAALGHATVATLERALGRPILADVAAAASEDVAWIDDGRIVFRHPLLAGVVYADARTDVRRAAHRRIAAAVDGEERARHHAMGADGPDPAVAGELAAAARVALRRGAPAAGADLLRLALQLTPPDDVAARLDRTVELGAYLKRAGDSSGAIATLDSVATTAPPGPERARARLALAAIRYETDEAGVAVELAEGAVEDAARDVELLARAHAVAAAVDWEDYRRRGRHVEAATRLLDGIPDPDPEVAGIVLMQRMQGDIDAGRPIDPELVERGLEAERRAPAVNVADRFSAVLGPALKYRDDLAGARRWIERTIETAMDEGDDGSMPYALSHLAEVELWAGSWARAEDVARRHLELARDLGLESQRRQAVYNLGLVLAHRGAFDEARELVEAGLRAAEADDDAWTSATLEPILGFIDLSLGDLASAAGHLRRATELRDALAQASPRRHDADLVEALVGTGAVAEAGAVSAAMDRRAAASPGRPSAIALAARARGLVAAAAGDLGAGRAAIDEALQAHDRAPFPFDRARTLLILGQIERRRRERRAAKVAFEEALAEFERLGAPAWAERARAELARVGLRRAASDLTASERRVAELAASGLTNREVAATLFVSAKTVESNLARAYGKLGIRSRAQLASALGPGAGAAPSPATPRAIAPVGLPQT